MLLSTTWRLRRYLVRRIGSSLISVAGVVALTFVLLHLIPGDPVDNLLGEDARKEDKAELRRCMDLDQSLPVQFGRFLRSIADGTLGKSCPDQKTTVAGRIVKVMPATVQLAMGGMVVALLLGLPLGIAAALRASYVHALTTGRTTRLVLVVGSNRYWIEDTDDAAESLQRWRSRTESSIQWADATRADWDRHLRPRLAREFVLATRQRDPAALAATGRIVFGDDLWRWVDPSDISRTGSREPGPGYATLEEILRRMEFL